MRFSCDYNTLLVNLQDVSNVVEDSLANEDTKNVIFQFKKTEEGNKVVLIGMSPTITFKRPLVEEDFSLTLEDSDLDANGVMFMQIKSKDLLAFLNSYKSLRKTRVNEVIFTPERNKFKCMVIESPALSEAESQRLDEELLYNPDMPDPRQETFASSWMFDSIPIKQNMLASINLVAPEGELPVIPRAYFKAYTSSLLPIMENTTSLYGHLVFSDKHVVGYNKAFTTIMSNALASTEVFSGIRLNYRSVSFIDKIICNGDSEDEISVAKMERYIYFKDESTEAFVVYDTKLVSYQAQLDLFAKDSCVKVDRIYLKDVLKRLSLTNDAIEVDIRAEEDHIILKNSHFEQAVPIIDKFGMDAYSSVRFKIMPYVLNEAIIGDDDNYATVREDGNTDRANTYIYYCKHEKSTSIAFADMSNSWFTIIRVKTY